MIRIFLGKPGCMPKGTLVYTPKGFIPIEHAHEVYSIGDDGCLCVKRALPLCSGTKNIFRINDIVCSPDHKFIVYDKFIRKIVDCQAKDIIKGVHFLLRYGIRETQIKTSIRRTEQLMAQPGHGCHKEDVSRGRHDSIIDSKKAEHWSSRNNKKASHHEHTFEVSEQCCKIGHPKISTKNKHDTLWKKQSFISTWQIYRNETKPAYLSGYCETIKDMATSILRIEENQSYIRSGHPSQKQRQQRQPEKQLDDLMSRMSCEITFLEKSSEKIEMYDLIVPDTNNFILEDGTISHNSGKSLSAVKEMYSNPEFKYYSNIKTEDIKNNILIRPEFLVKKTLVKVKKNGESVYAHEFNKEYWMNVKKKGEMLNIVLDEVQALYDARRAMSSPSKIMNDFIALIRKILSNKDASHGTCTMISQLDRRIDIIGIEMANQIRYHIAEYDKSCMRCGCTWHENNEIPIIKIRCPACGHIHLRQHNMIVHAYYFDGLGSYMKWIQAGYKTYFLHTIMKDGNYYFDKYDSFQWSDLLGF
jgi:hypothetical protein